MRRLLLIGGGVIGLGVLAVVALVFFVHGGGGDAHLATAAPPIPIAATELPTTPVAAQARPAAAADVPSGGATPPTTTPLPAPSPAPPSEVLHFALDTAQSSAKFLVGETVGLTNSTAVGNGSNITGDIYLTRSGALGPTRSSVKLDLRTLKSSDFLLSLWLATDDLNTRQFPFAEFGFDSVSGIPASYMDGNEFSFRVTGPLSMRGVTRTAAWTAKGRQSGAFLTVTADTDFLMTDYGMSPPDAGFAKAKNSVHLQVVFVSRTAG